MRSSDNFKAETEAANAPDVVRPRVLKALSCNRLGISFSGAAFGAAYQLGAAHMLQDMGLIHEYSPVGGTSAGGLVAVAVRCQLPYTDVLSALKQASSDLLEHGFKKRIRSVLKPILERLLPPDAHEKCNRSPALVLTASRLKGPCPACWKGQELREPFSSKEDLVQRLLVAVHEPKETDGRLCVRYHGHYYADGGMRLPVPPIPDADYSIIIYPVPNRLMKRWWPYRAMMHPPVPDAIAISPGEYRPWPYSNSYKDSDKLVMHPQPDEVLDMLFERGRRDALSWAQHIRLETAVAAAPAGTADTFPTAAAKPRLHGIVSSDHSQQQEQGYMGTSALASHGAADGGDYGAYDDHMAVGQQQRRVRFGASASRLLSTPVEQLPMVMPVEGKMLNML